MKATRPSHFKAILTGASSGVGASLARLLASKTSSLGYGPRSTFTRTATGLHLCGRDINNLKEVAESCRELSEGSCLVSTSIGDVGVESEVERMWKEYVASQASEKVDVFVANAGVNRTGDVEEVTMRDFDDVMNTNVKSVFLWLRHVLPVMRDQKKGQLIFTNSVRGLSGSSGTSVYTASKFALEGMTQSLRRELVGSGVKLGAVYPAGIATPWWTDSARGGVRARMPDTSRFLLPDDVADAMMSLVHQPEWSDTSQIVLENFTRARDRPASRRR